MPLPYDAFRARFSDAEKVRIELAQLHDAALPKTHPANLRALIADAAASGSVSLASARVQAGVAALGAAGLLDGEREEERIERAVQILAPEKTDEPEATVGGYTIGQSVRLLPPWSSHFPGEHTVEGFGPDSVLLSCGASMAASNLEPV